MKRLRHPIRAIEEPFGKAGLIVAVIALVLALTGAAFAAAGLSGKQKKEVEKIAKNLAGKPGTSGTNGAPGAKGDTGAVGANGTNGTNGVNGKSVAVVGNASAGECPSGGKFYEVEGSGVKNKVCNGTTGFTETLPKGKTETGTLYTEKGGPVFTPISFPIPLEQTLLGARFVPSSYPHIDPIQPRDCTGLTGTELTKCEAEQQLEKEQQEEEEEKKAKIEEFKAGLAELCPGTALSPQAEAGYLCVYESEEKSLNFGGPINGGGSVYFESARGNIRTGANAGSNISGPGGFLLAEFESPGEAVLQASWAVTAPEE
jgi:hypothetical protein